MRKRIFSGMLLVAALVASSSVFTSCKDTYTDDIAETKVELQNQINNLGQNLQAQIDALKAAQQQCKENCAAAQQNLQDQIDALKAALAANKSCECDCAAMKAEIQALKNQISALNNLVSALQAQDGILSDRITVLENKLNNLDLSQVEINKTDIQTLFGKVNDLTSLLNEVKATADAAKVAADAAQTAADNAQAAASQAQAAATQAAADAAAAQTTAQAAQAAAQAAQAAADAAQTAADAAQAMATQNAADIAAIKTQLQTIENNITDLQSRVTVLEGDVVVAKAQADAALALAKEDSVRIDALEAALAALPGAPTYDGYTKAEIDSMKNEVEQEIADAAKLAKKADDLALKAYNLADDAKTIAIEALNNAKVALDKIEALRQAMEAADQALQDQIDDINDELAEIQDKLADLEYNILNMVTNIILQSTENPVTGSFNTPFGLSSNLLCAFYGYNSGADIKFPSDVLPTEAQALLNYEDFEIFNGETLVDDMENGKANLGTLYATINPNTVDFTGQKLALETSAGNESPAVLSPLQASTKEITFGVTRAAANGFYSADAYVSIDDVESIKPNIDKEALKSVAKSALNKIKGSGNASLAGLYKDLMASLKNVMPAYALKATWTDADGQEKNIYSQYNLGVTAIQPASFEFLKGFAAPTFPAFNFDFNFNLKDANVPEIFNADYYVVTDADGKFAGVYPNEADAQARAAEVAGAYSKINQNDLSTYWDLVDRINKQLIPSVEYNINYLQQQLQDQFKDKFSDVVDRVNNLINKFNGKFSNINQYLQPALIYQTKEGAWVNASNVWLAPTPVPANGVFMIEPTSFTAELIAPAYKKYVAVTNVYDANDLSKNAQAGNEDCKGYLQTANGLKSYGTGLASFDSVFSGVKDVLFQMTAPAGYIYEVTYAAVDYSGKTVCNKYYFKTI